MADEPAKNSLDEAAVSADKASARRWFGRKKHQEALPFSHCENCGAELIGPHCAQCGQPAIDYRRSFGHVVLDALNEFINWDSKIFGTIGLLITRPWRLTNEFLAGKRVRHVHPLRLYLIAGFLFFLGVNFGAKYINFDPSKIPENERAQVAAAIADQRQEIEKELEEENLPEEQKQKVRETLDYLTKPGPSATAPVQESASPKAADKKNSPSPPNQNAEEHVGPRDQHILSFSDGTEPQTPFEQWLETRAKEKMGEHGTKMGLFIATLFSNLPYMMLCCVPLFAFVLKVLYVRKRIFYIDHLIYALHIHTFFYTGIVLIVLATMGLNYVIPGGFANAIVILLWITFAVQILLSIRYVYRQGWFLSIFKFFVGGFVYFFVLLLALAATFFVTLAIPT